MACSLRCRSAAPRRGTARAGALRSAACPARAPPRSRAGLGRLAASGGKSSGAGAAEGGEEVDYVSDDGLPPEVFGLDISEELMKLAEDALDAAGGNEVAAAEALFIREATENGFVTDPARGEVVKYCIGQLESLQQAETDVNDQIAEEFAKLGIKLPKQGEVEPTTPQEKPAQLYRKQDDP